MRHLPVPPDDMFPANPSHQDSNVSPKHDGSSWGGALRQRCEAFDQIDAICIEFEKACRDSQQQQQPWPQIQDYLQRVDSALRDQLQQELLRCENEQRQPHGDPSLQDTPVDLPGAQLEDRSPDRGGPPATPGGTHPATHPTSPPTGASPEIPEGLRNHPRYRDVTPLGSGGMGTVYRATDGRLDRTVALKVVHLSLADRPETLERFLREGKAAAQLNHPNIAHVLDADQLGQTAVLVMEFVDGQTLSEVVKEQGPLHPALACQYIHQVALALQHAHEHGIVHRDVKPSNVLISRTGQAKLTDFGLARRYQEGNTAAGLTQSCHYLGTPDYTAPEQAADARQADIRSDIYSLGCTLYHLLAGHPPFPDGPALQKLGRHQFEDILPIDTLRADLPEGLAEVLDKMLQKDPATRHAEPIEVAHALAPFAHLATVAEEAICADSRLRQSLAGGDCPHIALEPAQAQGESLETRLHGAKRQPFAVADAVHVALEMTRALQELHRKGIVQDEVTPTNVYLLNDKGSGTTQVRLILSQRASFISGEPISSNRTSQELHSVGEMLFEMLTGTSPQGLSREEQSMCLTQTQGIPTSHSSLRDLVMQLLDHQQQDQLPTTQELIEELDEVLHVCKRQPKAPNQLMLAMCACAIWGAVVALGLWQAPTVVRWATGKGVVVIESNGDVQIQLQQDGKEVVVLDTRTKRRWVIEAGKYNVNAVNVQERPDGVKVETKEFVLTRGGKKVLRVTTERPSPPPPPPPPPPPSPIVRVNEETNGEQLESRIATNSKGDMVIVWMSQQGERYIWDIRGRQYDANLKPRGKPFRLTSTIKGDWRAPGVAMREDGGFFVCFEEFRGHNIFGRLFDSQAKPLTNNISIPTTAGLQNAPAIAADSSGRIVVIWLRQNGAIGGNNVFGQCFDPNGKPVGTEFRINEEGSGYSQHLNLAASTHSIVTVRTTNDVDGGDISLRRFHSKPTPTPLGEVQFANKGKYLAGNQHAPSTATIPDGRFVVAWHSQAIKGEDGSVLGIYCQRFNEQGKPVGPTIRVNQFHKGAQSHPRVSMAKDGTFVVVWVGKGKGRIHDGIYARVFSADGKPQTGDLLVNNPKAGMQYAPDVVMKDNTFVVTWNGDGPGDNRGVFARQYMLKQTK